MLFKLVAVLMAVPGFAEVSCPEGYEQEDGVDYHGNDVECGDLTHDEAEDKCNDLGVKCMGYSILASESGDGWIEKNGGEVGQPWCLKKLLREKKSLAYKVFCKKSDLPKCSAEKSGCENWAKTGYCESKSQYYNYMLNNCPATCSNLCGGTDSENQVEKEETCKDEDTRCSNWAKQGYCEETSQYYKYMTDNCPLNCAGDCDTGEGDNCKVEVVKNCHEWQAKGYCETSSTYYNYMQSNCKTHCAGGCEGEVQEEEQSTCEEEDERCQAWTNAGYCRESSRYYGYMMKNCKANCCKCLEQTEENCSAELCQAEPAFCAGYVADGYCALDSNYFDYMQENCPEHCSGCDATAYEKGCYGERKECKSWVDKGYCTSGSYVTFMKGRCPKNCAKCFDYENAYWTGSAEEGESSPNPTQSPTPGGTVENTGVPTSSPVDTGFKCEGITDRRDCRSNEENGCEWNGSLCVTTDSSGEGDDKNNKLEQKCQKSGSEKKCAKTEGCVWKPIAELCTLKGSDEDLAETPAPTAEGGSGMSTMKEFTDFCKALEDKLGMESACEGCAGKFKKGKCKYPKSAKKIKCKKVKDQELCPMLGCSLKGNKKKMKCSGKPENLD